MAAPTLEVNGKRYIRTDRPEVQPEPHYGAPARPYDIPIKGDWGKTSGILGITSVVLFDTTLQAVAYPQRGRAHNSRDKHLWQPPEYTELMRDEHKQVVLDDKGKPRTVTRFMVWCPACAEWQRREAFYTDATRSNGLRGYCKTCESAQAAARYHRRKLAQAS